MTLSKEDVDKFTERLRELPYWELWNCIDEDWKRTFYFNRKTKLND
ncbi:MAG: hypothetical protein ACJZ78_00735 [Prochlorococcus marinus]